MYTYAYICQFYLILLVFVYYYYYYYYYCDVYAAEELSLLSLLLSRAAETLEKDYFKGETVSRGK